MTEPLRSLGARASDLTAQAVALVDEHPLFAPQLYAFAAYAAGVTLWCAVLAVTQHPRDGASRPHQQKAHYHDDRRP